MCGPSFRSNVSYDSTKARSRRREQPNAMHYILGLGKVVTPAPSVRSRKLRRLVPEDNRRDLVSSNVIDSDSDRLSTFKRKLDPQIVVKIGSYQQRGVSMVNTIKTIKTTQWHLLALRRSSSELIVSAFTVWVSSRSAFWLSSNHSLVICSQCKKTK